MPIIVRDGSGFRKGYQGGRGSGPQLFACPNCDNRGTKFQFRLGDDGKINLMCLVCSYAWKQDLATGRRVSR